MRGVDRWWARVVYARARTYIYRECAQVLMIKS
nr:MAG TPA: DVL family [Caudoviricetes sp.]